MGQVTSSHTNSSRYFIAIIPPQDVERRITQLKVYCSETYGSKAALNSPSHLTLHMPFDWKEEKEEILCDALKNFFQTMPTFDLALSDFSTFTQKTIFVKVLPTAPLIQLEYELHKFCKINLNLFNARYRDLPFHPHVTIAFRDLKKTAFAKAWDDFKDRKFQERFNVVTATLLKHNGKLWIPHSHFSLN